MVLKVGAGLSTIRQLVLLRPLNHCRIFAKSLRIRATVAILLRELFETAEFERSNGLSKATRRMSRKIRPCTLTDGTRRLPF
jgi:hypothetical protein